MGPVLRRILLFGSIGLAALVSAPFVLMGLDAALVSAGIYDDEAVAVLPDRIHSLAIRRRPIWHPILGNEFYRSAVIRRAGKDIFRGEIGADTGGYPLGQVFSSEDGNLILIDVFSCYRADLQKMHVYIVRTVDRAKLQFIGTFDEDGEHHHFRFFGVDERPLKPFPNNVEAPRCLSSQPN